MTRVLVGELTEPHVRLSAAEASVASAERARRLAEQRLAQLVGSPALPWLILRSRSVTWGRHTWPLSPSQRAVVDFLRRFGVGPDGAGNPVEWSIVADELALPAWPSRVWRVTSGRGRGRRHPAIGRLIAIRAGTICLMPPPESIAA